MEKNTIQTSIEIIAPIAKVWDALTNPVAVKAYFFGTAMETTWKVGDPIFFKGSWEGKEYCDKGTVKAFVPGEMLSYDYWSGFSGLADVPENYQTVTYTVAAKGGWSEVGITQSNIDTEDRAKHSKENWDGLLKKMKEYVETTA